MVKTCINQYCKDGWITNYRRKFDAEFEPAGRWLKFEYLTTCLCCMTQDWTQAPPERLVEAWTYENHNRVELPIT